jgi:hypothetical protein
MNGVLTSQDMDAVSIPAASAGEFNSSMVDLCDARWAQMMGCVVDCHPDAAEIRRLDPGAIGRTARRAL